MFDRSPAGGSIRPDLVLVCAAVLVAATLFFPRPTNFAPIGAFGLFVGAYASGRWVWLYPLLALAPYVLVVGAYPWLVLGSVALGFAGAGAIGALWLRPRVGAGWLGGATLATSVWFFLISNLGSWVVFGVPRGESLLHHYLLGVPFFWNTLAGDVLFTVLLFGGYAVATRASVARRASRGSAELTG